MARLYRCTMPTCTPDISGIRQAIEVLQQGGVVAHATETCYGLACDLSNHDALAKLFAIKDRPGEMPVSALFADIEQARQYLEWNDLADQLAHDHLPGPLTIILKQKPDAPHHIHVTPTTDNRQPTTIGLRISPHPTAKALVKQFGSPLSTTSANIHGKPNPYSVDDLQSQFADANTVPDLILDDGTLEGSDASTVVDVSEGVVHVLRKGDIAL